MYFQSISSYVKEYTWYFITRYRKMAYNSQFGGLNGVWNVERDFFSFHSMPLFCNFVVVYLVSPYVALV